MHPRLMLASFLFQNRNSAIFTYITVQCYIGCASNYTKCVKECEYDLPEARQECPWCQATFELCYANCTLLYPTA